MLETEMDGRLWEAEPRQGWGVLGKRRRVWSAAWQELKGWLRREESPCAE